MEISVVHDQPPLLYNENSYEPHQHHSCLLRWRALCDKTSALLFKSKQMLIQT